MAGPVAMGTEVITTLLIDEAFDEAQTFGRALSHSIHPRLAVVHCATLQKAVSVMQTAAIDVTVVALSVFESAAFGASMPHFPSGPVVVAVEPEREADAIRALDAAAQDYFAMGKDSRIAARIIGSAAERTRLQAALESYKSTLNAGAARLNAITSTTSTAFFVFDPEGIVTFAAGDAFTTAAISAQEMIGKSVFDLYANNKVAIASYRRVPPAQQVSPPPPPTPHPDLFPSLLFL